MVVTSCQIQKINPSFLQYKIFKGEQNTTHNQGPKLG